MQRQRGLRDEQSEGVAVAEHHHRRVTDLQFGQSDYERAEFWIEKRAQIDDVVQKPARTLLALVKRALERTKNDGLFYTVPAVIDQDIKQEPDTTGDGSLLVHAVVCSTVQMLYDQSRRYGWLDAVADDLSQTCAGLSEMLANHPARKEKTFLKRLDILGEPAFGALNPLTAAEVFWVLIRAGEKYAHGEVGFFALFSLLWSLKRDIEGRFVAGASIGEWHPTVAVTARCVLPILQLLEIIAKRAALYRDLEKACNQLRDHEGGGTQFDRWRFASALGQMSATLRGLAKVCIDPKAVEKAADDIERLADRIGPDTAVGPIAPKVREKLRVLFVRLGKGTAKILKEADAAIVRIESGLLVVLRHGGPLREQLKAKCRLTDNWKVQHDAAKEAAKVCRSALKKLQRIVTILQSVPNQKNALKHGRLVGLVSGLASANDGIRRILDEAIKENAEWCRNDVPREVAFASAGDDSEFDAAELLSGVVVAERTGLITRASIEDAVRHSLRASRADGSWVADQPIYLERRYVGVWPGTSDLLLLLSNAVRVPKGPKVADSHLLRYVDWLEARRRRQLPQWSKEELWGFPSESWEKGIDFWATATAVRGLLEIREIIEERLWEICEDRFTILEPQRGVTGLDPVDLGAIHGRRLQTRLLRTAASTRQNKPDAEYAFVLHGPPGSSKTAIAEAIGREMWSPDEARFVRITPADFTRGGEDGVDVEARFIFRLLSHVRGVTIFFDEIDDLLRKRDVKNELSFIRLVIPGMLNRLQDLRDAAPRQEICFLLATNYVDQIEPALTRRGRIDATLPVPYPDPWSRESILERIAADKGKDLPPALKEEIVSRASEWPWAIYQKLCKEMLRGEPDMNKVIRRFASDFESADYYYRIKERWEARSPLTTEFVHLAFARSKVYRECRERVEELQAFLQKSGVSVDEHRMIDTFRRTWRERRESP